MHSNRKRYMPIMNVDFHYMTLYERNQGPDEKPT